VIDIKFSKNSIKIYEKNATDKDFTGNVNSVELRVIYDMIFECAASNDDNKKMTITKYNNRVEIMFNVFYGKHFSYNFQIVAMQKTANENDLLSMMSSMQCDIMELKKKNDELIQKTNLQDDFIKFTLCNGLIDFHDVPFNIDIQ
jgi:hypothetical protein